MFNLIINVWTGLLSVIGTVTAVLSILKLKPRDLWLSVTFLGMDSNDLSLLTQRNQARLGVVLVLISWLFEGVNSFIAIEATDTFWKVLFIEMTITVLMVLIVCYLNKVFKMRYEEYRKELKKRSAEKINELGKSMDEK